MFHERYCVLLAVVLVGTPNLGYPEELTQEIVCEQAYCREPVTVTLRLDEETVMDFQVEGIPIAFERDVNLFVGESANLSVETENGEIRSIAYEPDSSQDDGEIAVRFSQSDEEPFGMMLVVENSLDQFIRYKAFIAVPNHEGFSYTSSCPVGPGMSSYESWPYPISHIVMADVHFIEIDMDDGAVEISCE